jgi:acyl dehydratase
MPESLLGGALGGEEQKPEVERSEAPDSTPLMALARYFNDFVVGQVFQSAEYQVTEDEIVAFARQYDPQPMHTDPEIARHTEFGGLIASGFHTAAVTMRLFVMSDASTAQGSVGAGIDRLRWRYPVRPGDRLHASFTIENLTPSTRRPGWGTVRTHAQVRNQNDVEVLEALMSALVPGRPLGQRA